MRRAFLGVILVLVSCSKAQAAGPSTDDALRAEHAVAASLRTFGKFGYPEVDKADYGEQPVAVSNLKCDHGDCAYDVVVASKSGRRTIHRPGVHFCQDPQNAWVQCAS
jgi:hypothetical protein